MTEGTSGLEQRHRRHASRNYAIRCLERICRAWISVFYSDCTTAESHSLINQEQGNRSSRLWITGHNAPNETTGFRSSLYRFDKD